MKRKRSYEKGRTMEVRINPETDPVSFDDPDEAKNFIEKKFREFEGEDRERLKIEIRKQ